MEQINSIFVDIHGTPHRALSNAHCDFDILAKKLNNSKYFILVSNDGDLFDPTNIKVSIKQPDRQRGGRFWRLRRCSLKCYMEYTSFLRSKNRTPYILAQRSFINDF